MILFARHRDNKVEVGCSLFLNCDRFALNIYHTGIYHAVILVYICETEMLLFCSPENSPGAPYLLLLYSGVSFNFWIYLMICTDWEYWSSAKDIFFNKIPQNANRVDTEHIQVVRYTLYS